MVDIHNCRHGAHKGINVSSRSWLAGSSRATGEQEMEEDPQNEQSAQCSKP